MARRKQTETDLAEWIEAELLAPPAVTRLRLYHTTADKGGELVHKVRPGEDIDGKVAEEGVRLASELWAKARHDADSYADSAAVQRYKVVSESKEGRRGQFAWSFEPPRVSRTGDAGLSEPATPQGLLASLMRSNNEKDRIIADLATGTFDPMRQTIDALTRSNEALLKYRHESLEAMAEISLKKHEQDADMLVLASEQDRKDFLVKKLANEIGPALLPAVAKWLGGKFGDVKALGGAETAKPKSEVPPAKAEPLAASERDRIKKILEALPPEKAAGLVASLSNEDADFLFSLTQSKAE